MDSPDLVVDVGGVAVAVIAERSYVDFATDRIGSLRASKEPSLVLRIEPTPPEPPDREPDQHLESIDAWFEPGSIWMRFGSATTRVAGPEVVVGGAIDNKFDYKSIDLMVQFGLAAAIAGPDRIMVHGAVVARGESALLVIGMSGAGKSTAATAAFVNDWDLLTDDLAVAHPAEGRVRGVARSPRVPTALAELFGLDGEGELGKRERTILDSDILAAGDRQLVGVVTVHHGTDGSLERLRESDIKVIDDALAVPPFGPVMRSHLAPAAALVALPTFRLLHASDEAIRVEKAAELLDEALRLAVEI